MGMFDDFFSLFRGTNVTNADSANSETATGVTGPLLDELKLEISDDDLAKRAKQWESKWKTYEGEIKVIQDENEEYWLGLSESKAMKATKNRKHTENRIFADCETFLPIANRVNPEPLVNGSDTEEGQMIATKTAKMLMHQTDIQKLKLKIKKATRFWMLYHLGVAKISWSVKKNDIQTKIIRTPKIILDPDATIDEDGYTGEYIGEYREETAKKLMNMFKSKKEEIKRLVNGKTGTMVKFIEWWTDEMVFWTLNGETIGAMKNPHFNYERAPKEEEGAEDDGSVEAPKKGDMNLKNHFKHPRMPYEFLSVFNLGKHPHDDTGLIQQNIGMQDSINRLNKQIDKNVGEMNGGGILSGEFFSDKEAQQVANGIRKGKWIRTNGGDASRAMKQYTGVALPGDVYQYLQDTRNQMDNVFGIHSTTRGERTGQETYRGRALLKGGDESRIGSIAEYIEQFTDGIYNQWVQFMHVYYDEEHVAAILGDEKAKEFERISREDFNQSVPRRDEEGNEMTGEDGDTIADQIDLLVSVREGSMIPHDPVVEREEAVDLYGANALDPITLFERLDFANPREAALKLYKWMNAPELLFPEIQEEMAALKAQQAPPAPVVDPAAGIVPPDLLPPGAVVPPGTQPPPAPSAVPAPVSNGQPDEIVGPGIAKILESA